MTQKYWIHSGPYGYSEMYLSVEDDTVTFVSVSGDRYDSFTEQEPIDAEGYLNRFRRDLSNQHIVTFEVRMNSGYTTFGRETAEKFVKQLERILNARKARTLESFKAEAYIFDKDGTLLDTESVWFEAYKRLLEPYELKHTLAVHRQLLGLSADACVALLQGKHSELPQGEVAALELKHERLRLFRLVRIGMGVRLMEGVEEFLKKGKIPYAIATSATREDTEAEIQFLGWEKKFKAIVTADDVVNHKPAPDIYLEAAKRLGVDPTKCVAFEDGLGGAQSALAAGMKVVFVQDKRHGVTPPKDVWITVDSFKALLEAY